MIETDAARAVACEVLTLVRSRMRVPALALALGVALGAGACTAPESTDEPVTEDPNAGLLRDFLDGKFDAAGHPLNARTTEAETLCAATGVPSNGSVRIAPNTPCIGQLNGAEQQGDLVASLHLHVASAAASGTILSASIVSIDGSILASQQLTTSQLRGTPWLDLPLSWRSTGVPVTVRIAPAPGAVIDLDYVELFPSRFGLVASPGSGVIADADKLVFELPRSKKLDKVKLDGVDITSRLDDLLASGKAKRTTTDFRTLVEVSVGDLLPDRDDSAELELRAGSLAARAQLRRDAIACNYEGDATGVRVLVTGFQPFPADGWHENVSAVAVSSLDYTQLRDARVMRVVMPVEYDRAAAEVTDLIARCQPDAVISFGQGGGEIALEKVAYNLQDTGEVPGGVPDNRGVIRAAVPIDPAAPATRDTLLPLDDIRDALEAIGESPVPSTDPGRYICNNVMFADIGAMSARGGIAGFIHLPYTEQFDADTRARFGNVALAAVQATADSLR
jgi:pyroglutamyl-peptidase